MSNEKTTGSMNITKNTNRVSILDMMGLHPIHHRFTKENIVLIQL